MRRRRYPHRSPGARGLALRSATPYRAELLILAAPDARRSTMPKPAQSIEPASRSPVLAADAPPPPTHHLPADAANDLGECSLWVGDCRELLPRIPACRDKQVDLVFADPPFNWNRAYDKWDDLLPDDEYLRFTYDWLDLCVDALKPAGSIWVNIPDDWAAEIVVHLKKRGLQMVNWCVWHYRFGQNTTGRFINSKVHALYFSKDSIRRVWNPKPVMEQSDRAAVYNDPRTFEKTDGSPAGLRIPMDVWYGPYWGRIQGNNTERRAKHDNQLPEVYLERVIRCSSNPGQIVLDPFIGSGTTPVIARALGRHFVGTEFSDANAASAFERVQAGPVRVTREPRVMSTAITTRRGGTAAEAKILRRKERQNAEIAEVNAEGAKAGKQRGRKASAS